MTVVEVPDDGDRLWPTLGPQVVDFLEDCAVHGPGDLRGEPARVDRETKKLIYRCYEVYPQGHRQAGRRRFKRCCVSLRKGTAKTERGAWVAYAELHPEGPVRCDGFDADGDPVGRPVTDPFIPMVAYTEEQTEELAYGALYVVVTEGPDVDLFDPGLERIMRADGAGKAAPFASSPSARDGARTTFQHFDETHRMKLARLKRAHQTMLANVPKRPMSDPWSLETTTAPEPGGGSVAENTWQYAQQVLEGEVEDPRLFFFHRQASKGVDGCRDDDNKIQPDKLREQVVEASGPTAEWSDVSGILSLFLDPTTDLTYAERVWLNRRVSSGEKAFDRAQWDNLADPKFGVADGAVVTLGFDGARRRDATALVATHVESGFQWPLGIWERPWNATDDWQVDASQVVGAFEAAFDRFEVWRAYCDPPMWRETVAELAGRFGDDKVVEWWTNRTRPMAYALWAYREAQGSGDLSHDGSSKLAEHVGNAYRVDTNRTDDEDRPLWLIAKSRSDSPDKIDGAMAGCLSWEARRDAITAGVLKQTGSIYETRGLATL